MTVENPSFVTLLQETQFDTIYHEHFSYLSAHAVAAAIARRRPRADAGREADHPRRLQPLLAHPHRRARGAPQRRADHRRGAARRACSTPELWDDFARAQPRRRSTACARGSTSSTAAGRTVAGYGAAAKGNTLMNAAGVRSDDLVVVVDGSEAKQGKFLPGQPRPGRGTVRRSPRRRPTTC